MQIFRKIFSLLSAKEHRQVYLLFATILVSALVDMLSIVSIMPFMAVVTNPEIIETNAYLNQVYYQLGFTGSNQFLVFLGLIMLSLIIVANSLRLGALWYITRFVHFSMANLSRKLLQFYLMQPYHYFLNRNTADMSKNILEEVSRVIQRVLQPLLEFIAKGAVSLVIFAMLLVVDPFLSMCVIFGLGGIYALVFLTVRRKLGLLGERRVLANQGRFQCASEALGGIKDLKVLGREKNFLDKFAFHARELAFTEGRYALMTHAPKFFLEAIAFGGILLIVIYILTTSTHHEQILPVLALYAFAGYRLMPCLQMVFVNLGTIRFNMAALDVLIKDLQEKTTNLDAQINEPVEPLPINQDLVLENITFRYPQASEPALSNLSLCIKSNTTVGFVGSTGSGKTTAIDVILGLLTPQKGCLKIDGVQLSGKSVVRWQRNIGYVPQFIYLSDDTVAQNIAFGVPESKMDIEAVERAALIANLHDFIVQNLPQGYQTRVGERGIRLSGGQRQRIGIARAMYHNPGVLILDEATSALDNLTEEHVMQAIRDLSSKKTILMIAHRLSTVKECDEIFILENGALVASGTYAELMKKNLKFQLMARKSKYMGQNDTDKISFFRR